MVTARAVLFGVPIDGYTMAEALDVIDECVRNGRSHERTYQVTTVNVDFLVNAISNPDVMELLQHAELNLADGTPLLWASRLLDTPLPERVAGADLVPLLARESSTRGWRVHLFGAAPGVAARARAKMLETHPDALITADAGPSAVNDEVPDEAVVESIRVVDPDILCVALGNPKQERFIASHRDALRCPVMIGIGGSLDIFVGDKRRAPTWAQRFGAEWVFRAAQEPGRLGRRYLHDLAVFGPALHRYRRAVRRYRATGPFEISDFVTPPSPASSTAIDAHPHDPIASLVLNFDGIDQLSPRMHGQVIGALREAELRQAPIIVNGVSASLRACLEDYRTLPILGAAAT
jgi:N-acetylglucosaminyldiphosphoundecaprenol N-acetyl-beta-D-mannosaminyltransferase